MSSTPIDPGDSLGDDSEVLWQLEYGTDSAGPRLGALPDEPLL
ncbi:hypothetical protein NVV95_05915 [Herbiconiux sp. CPCC 205716]|uniref:Uncharacterized protein n=1 Tax=Herbiconiux gentiana TaxID=2970912 RepID=A0ABT2GCY8_9MICO|nr:hypothetical protein [Herbiconiux gentiana]MCS5714086.1 hypothetical protein [Herbiconiux gentiana]